MEKQVRIEEPLPPFCRWTEWLDRAFPLFFFFFFRTNIKKFKWRILTSDVIFDRVFQRTVILKKRNGI